MSGRVGIASPRHIIDRHIYSIIPGMSVLCVSGYRGKHVENRKYNNYIENRKYNNYIIKYTRFPGDNMVS